MAMFGALIDDALERWARVHPVQAQPRRDVLLEYIAEHIERTGFAPSGWHTVEGARIYFSPVLASDSHSET